MDPKTNTSSNPPHKENPQPEKARPDQEPAGQEGFGKGPDVGNKKEPDDLGKNTSSATTGHDGDQGKGKIG